MSDLSKRLRVVGDDWKPIGNEAADALDAKGVLNTKLLDKLERAESYLALLPELKAVVVAARETLQQVETRNPWAMDTLRKALKELGDG